MRDIDHPEIERRLREIPLTPAPGYLRARVLDDARRHKAAKSRTSHRQRLWLAGYAAVLLLVFVGDGFVSNVQRTRLVTLSRPSIPEAPSRDDQNGLLAEVFGGVAVPRLEAAGKIPPARRIRLASSLSEDPEIELLTEDSHDSPKNLH